MKLNARYLCVNIFTCHIYLRGGGEIQPLAYVTLAAVEPPHHLDLYVKWKI
jgi:hypothetical protein